MEPRHEFSVRVPVDDAWRAALLAIERVAPCLPGATVEEYDDKTVTGSVRVKVGPITCKGTAVFEERDEEARRVVLVAGGRDARGQGTARATVTGTLSRRDGVTAVTVHTDPTVTGRPAQFGRGVLSEVGERIVGQFAACPAQRLTEPADGQDGAREERTAAGERTSPDDRAPEQVAPASEERLDLLRTAGTPVVARAAAAPAAVVVVAASVLRIRRRRNARKNRPGAV
ncbi:SRPBCC family protein [Streptomyces sp. SMS_SU21]|uniref:SRPBCC family protein n=1 Tax=Streptomyces sp. SMS_SU21 TaxID=2069440 RepID=UPI000C88CEC1|nr:SRPBCC family protein [Streptomyces sp. SMS_SU21]MCA2202196.1 SRPBCC family protein [Streptomyces sp. SMS_SU21]